MLYKPEKGQFKDNCMIYNNGTYYLFSMYHKENSDKYNNIWLATSKDGIHFEDYGCVVENFPDYIWAMKVYRTEDAYYINSGSFSRNGKQAVLKFWKSDNLVDWEYVPEMNIESPELEDENSGSAILFDTYGKCEIAYIKDNQIKFIEDTISFGSTAPYYLESGKTYSIRILSKGGMFEIYVDDLYLQTFNNAHTPESISKEFSSFGAISCRSKCTLSNIKIYHMI